MLPECHQMTKKIICKHLSSGVKQCFYFTHNSCKTSVRLMFRSVYNNANQWLFGQRKKKGSVYLFLVLITILGCTKKKKNLAKSPECFLLKRGKRHWVNWVSICFCHHLTKCSWTSQVLILPIIYWNKKPGNLIW